jgi:predicted CopG family antitoxin
MAISIKISEENYKRLCSLSGRLQNKLHKPVSINEAISFLCKKRKLGDLAGTWDMSDKEVTSFTKDLHKGWKKWTIKSV